MKKQVFDVCVIGTGAGGGVMIDRLTAAGFSVVALERGPNLPVSEFDDDELRNGVRDLVFSANQEESFRNPQSGEVEAGRFSLISHCVGGTITHWDGMSWRFRPDEFKVLSTEGSVAGASLADWPISYEDMEPYYEQAEWDFGISGIAGAHRTEPKRNRGYPNPPHPYRSASKKIEKGAKAMGYQPFPIPLAINSQAYGGRPACMRGGACRAYGCPIHAKSTTYAISLPRAMQTGKLDLRADATVFDLPVKNGRVTGARYLDAKGNAHEVLASQVICAAGTIGTPHIMLQSRSGGFANGLANGSGLVGKNLQFHHFPGTAAYFDDDMHGYTGFEGHVALDDLHPSDPKNGFIRGGVLIEVNVFSHQPINHSLALSEGQGASRRWGPGLKDHMRNFSRTVQLVGVCEELPMESNQVALDPEIKDRFGLPVPQITKGNHPNDVIMNKWYGDRIVEIFEAAGAAHIDTASVPGFDIKLDTPVTGSEHNHGTCRMGDNPNQSVLNKWCQSHEVPNFWVADGSVMPTNGGYNPTLTILANSYRVADHFIGQARRNSL
jgi:choline dehydrogenase-like flavoprotein